MPYKAAKISFDGSHYIATPKENFPQGRRRRKARPLPDAELDKKEQFETAYTESKKLPRKERKTFLLDALKDTIPDKAQREEFIAQHTERKKSTPYGANRGFPRKYTCRNGTIFARLPTTTKSTPKKLSESLYGTHLNTL